MCIRNLIIILKAKTAPGVGSRLLIQSGIAHRWSFASQKSVSICPRRIFTPYFRHCKIHLSPQFFSSSMRGDSEQTTICNILANPPRHRSRDRLRNRAIC
jgi:hypothetical protein